MIGLANVVRDAARGWWVSGGRATFRASALLAALLLPVVAGTRPAGAAPLAVRIAGTANYGGNYQPGEWAPITVALANDGPDVTGDVVADVGPGSPRYTQRVELPTRSQKALTLYVRTSRGTSSAQVRFDSGKGKVEAPPVKLRELRQGQRLVGIVADDAAAGEGLARSIVAAYGSTKVETVVLPPDEIAANSYGLGSLAVLVIGDATTGRWSAEQRAAVAAWAARGGQLVLTGGANWRKIGEGLGELPALRATDSRTIANLNGLSRLGVTANPLTGQFVVVTGEPAPDASRPAEQDGLTLVANRPWGRGTVTSLAFDPGASGFAAWGGAAAFWQRLNLDAAQPAPLHEPFDDGYKSHNIGNVLRDLPSLALPPTWALGFVVLLYIIAVGPVNYLVLRRLDRRELGWVTIPLLTVVFTGAIYAFGAGTKGRATVVNTVSVVRIAPGARAAEAQAFYGVFTPSRGVRAFDLGRDALFTGFSAGGGLGDLQELGDGARFDQGANAGVRGASFAQWTQRTVAAQATIDPAPLALQVELRREGPRIVGTVMNPTAVPAEEVVLLLDGAYRQVGDLAPGANMAIDWTPTPGANTYQPGLGTALYYTTGGGAAGSGYVSGGPSRQPGKLGTRGRRAETLDALSGSVLAYGRRNQYGGPYGNPYAPAPTPTPTPRPGTGGAGTGAPPAAPVQVLFWRPDTPLHLRIDAGERNVTSLVIQEVVPAIAGGGR